MKPPCEEMFKDMLPTMRAILVKDLVERHRLSQVEVAKHLGVTQPAVSQYLSLLRGTSRSEALLRKDDFMRSLRELSDGIADGKMRGNQLTEMCCKLCVMLRNGK